jgi:hypothetical protein
MFQLFAKDGKMRSDEPTKAQRIEEHYEQDKKMLAKTEGPDIFTIGSEPEMAYVQGSGEPVPLWKVAEYFTEDIMKIIEGIAI